MNWVQVDNCHLLIRLCDRLRASLFYQTDWGWEKIEHVSSLLFLWIIKFGLEGPRRAVCFAFPSLPAADDGCDFDKDAGPPGGKDGNISCVIFFRDDHRFFFFL